MHFYICNKLHKVHITVLLCVFNNDNEEKMLVKQITNWTVFGENQTATTTFIACLARFRLISQPFENLHRIPTGPRGFITVPIPMGIPVPTAAVRNSLKIIMWSKNQLFPCAQRVRCHEQHAARDTTKSSGGSTLGPGGGRPSESCLAPPKKMWLGPQI